MLTSDAQDAGLGKLYDQLKPRA